MTVYDGLRHACVMVELRLRYFVIECQTLVSC